MMAKSWRGLAKSAILMAKQNIIILVVEQVDNEVPPILLELSSSIKNTGDVTVDA